MICGRIAAGRRRWNGPTESAHRVTLCPGPIRSEGTRTPSGAPISSQAGRPPARISSPRSPPERPPIRPPAAPIRPTIRPAAWLDFRQNSDHPSRGGQKIGVKKSAACDYCINGMSLLLGMPLLSQHAAYVACGICARAETSRAFRFSARMWSLRGASPTQKQATCRASYKRSVQCSMIALLSTYKACCLLWRYDSP